ncbi:MAG: hypothetical protein LBT29_04610 [Flavobacteriaceae bacterium]|jgi:hypothetical protein|nr:hypothetical protein [Flavobacteriaceae bacterium]
MKKIILILTLIISTASYSQINHPLIPDPDTLMFVKTFETNKAYEYGGLSEATI